MSKKLDKDEKKSLVKGLAIIGMVFVLGYKYGDVKARCKMSSDFINVLSRIDKNNITEKK